MSFHVIDTADCDRAKLVSELVTEVKKLIKAGDYSLAKEIASIIQDIK